jgi:two-component system KDP operon response regulator KdpE
MKAAARRVLVVEHDAARRTSLRTSLSEQGYEVAEASDGMQALGQVAWREPSIILFDLDLPDVDGLHVVGRIRERSDVPIIVISGRNDESETIEALDRGANDFMTRPFRMGPLLARIRALLRLSHRPRQVATVLSVGKLDIDLAGQVVRLAGEQVQLSRTEYEFLQVLAKQQGRVVSRRSLLTAVWGPNFADRLEYLPVIVRRLRQKLEAVPSAPRILLTVAGVGYRLSGVGNGNE